VKAKFFMNAPPEVVEILRLWIRKAEHDLEAATRTHGNRAGMPLTLAAEKVLRQTKGRFQSL
jgi:hypothetical protein